jgi:hypothetical protein
MKNEHNVVLLAGEPLYWARQAARMDAAVSAAALRMRRSRERRKTGQIVLPPLVVDEAFVEWLISAGFLEYWCEEPQQILQAVQRLHRFLYEKDKLI